MSHDGSGRDSCLRTISIRWFHFETPEVARGVTDPGVGSGALLGGLGIYRRPAPAEPDREDHETVGHGHFDDRSRRYLPNDTKPSIYLGSRHRTRVFRQPVTRSTIPDPYGLRMRLILANGNLAPLASSCPTALVYELACSQVPE